MSDFLAHAYEMQAEHFAHAPEHTGEVGERLFQSWFDESSADYWRQSRMYEFARLFAHERDAKWLTVGDGRCGLDSVELRKRGISNVLPSDISEHPLRKAKECGLITDYAVENAERLSFGDDAFDYVLCKEAYHHFPRPFLALYEMLRVARRGVILIEPSDYGLSPVGLAVFQLKRLLGKAAHIDQNRYETQGNYVYTLDEREIEKACLGLDLPLVAFKGLNDVYLEGAEFAPATLASPVFVRMRLLIAVLDVLCGLRLFKPTRLMACIFKRTPSAELAKRLRGDGWKLVNLPRNPYNADHS